jgi:hypothetical protein
MKRLLPFIFAATCGAADLSKEEAEARWNRARQIAREMNDRALVQEIETTGESLKAGLKRREIPEVEGALRALERKVGIDPGGWSMQGQRIARLLPATAKGAQALAQKLEQAMASDDLVAVRAVVAEMSAVPGYEPGLPDVRRAGLHAEAQPLSSDQATALFQQVLHREEKIVQQVAEGRAINDNMLRLYADLVRGCVAIRPFLADPSEVDRVIVGGCEIMLAHQQPAGFFPFPDLRGKNIRFGEMAEALLRDQPEAAKDGWLVLPDPKGGTQFDTGECGAALLVAAGALSRDEWRQAGLRAAEWALAQKCVPNFNYNAFSVSLLCAAHRTTGERRWLDGALRKFRVGVAPGQAPNGRWIDPHNARTVYHFIILRALNDLAESTEGMERQEVDAVRVPATQAMLDEFTALGVTETSFALRELARARQLGGLPPAAVSEAVEQSAAVVRDLCARGERSRARVAFTQAAALSLIATKR